MTAPILTVTLNPAIDKTLLVDPRSNEEQQVKKVLLSAGGKGLNVSRVLSRLGINTLATGFIGGINGQWLEGKLKNENLSSSFVRIAGETRTSLTVRETKTGRISRFLEEGPVVSKKEISEFQRRYIALLKKVNFVILSGRIIPGVKETFYYDLIRLAQQHGKKVVLDTSGVPLIAGLKAKPFLIKPNLEEAEFIFGRPLKSLAAVKKGVKHLAQHGISHSVISMGHKGAVATDGKILVYARPRPNWKFINSVGCGDSFVAGFIAGIVRGKDFVENVRWGVSAAVSSAMQLQPGAVNAGQVKRFIPQIIVKQEIL